MNCVQAGLASSQLIFLSQVRDENGNMDQCLLNTSVWDDWQKSKHNSDLLKILESSKVSLKYLTNWCKQQ